MSVASSTRQSLFRQSLFHQSLLHPPPLLRSAVGAEVGRKATRPHCEPGVRGDRHRSALVQHRRRGTARSVRAFNIGEDLVDDTDPFYAAERHRMFAENIWPATPTLLRSALVAYFAEARRVALTLTDVFALALGLPDFWFRSAARVRAGSASQHGVLLRCQLGCSRRRCPDLYRFDSSDEVPAGRGGWASDGEVARSAYDDRKRGARHGWSPSGTNFD